MAELTHNELPPGEDGFHEIQLSGKQLVFLFMATTIVAVVIFLCGVQVGRGVKNDRVSDNSDAIAATPAPSAASGPSQPAAASSGPPAAEPPAPAPEPDDELSYAKRLQGDSAPQEQLKSRAPTEDKPAAAPPKAVSPIEKSAPKPQPAASAPPPPAASATDAGPSRRNAEAPKAGNWVVQVHALKDRAAAAKIAQGLVSKGYPAFVLDPEPGSPVIYRVQVGRYGDRREAEEIARRLEKDEQYKPIIHSVK